MAPKKKNRGNKLARMTEEEKSLYLQHKAAMEEEAQRRKQELVATFLKNLKDKFKNQVALLQMKDVSRTLQANKEQTIESSPPFCLEMQEMEDDSKDPLSYSKYRSFWKWKSFNNVTMNYELLKKQKQELIAENKSVKKSLETYIYDFSSQIVFSSTKLWHIGHSYD